MNRRFFEFPSLIALQFCARRSEDRGTSRRVTIIVSANLVSHPLSAYESRGGRRDAEEMFTLVNSGSSVLPMAELGGVEILSNGKLDRSFRLLSVVSG